LKDTSRTFSELLILSCFAIMIAPGALIEFQCISRV
jgi:hypothetical protein